MLNVRNRVLVEGESVQGGVVVQGYRAEINEVNPEDLNMSDWIADKAGYKAHREQARADAREFEEMVYKLQDEMIAAKNAHDADAEE